MGCFERPRGFHPLDLEIMDLVYEAAWAQIEAHQPFRDRNEDRERQDALRKQLFALATPPVDFDTLYDKVLAPEEHPRQTES